MSLLLRSLLGHRQSFNLCRQISSLQPFNFSRYYSNRSKAKTVATSDGRGEIGEVKRVKFFN